MTCEGGLFAAATPEGGEEEVAQAFRVAGFEVGTGEIESKVAGEVGEAFDHDGAVEAADFLDEGFVQFRVSHGGTRRRDCCAGREESRRDPHARAAHPSRLTANDQ